MIGAIFLLLACQLTGEVVVRTADLPVPGPVLGMVFLFIWLCIRKTVSENTETVSNALLGNMSLLFVPAGVGVIRYTEQIQNEALAILVSIVAGTVITIVIVAKVAQALMPKPHPEHAPGEPTK